MCISSVQLSAGDEMQTIQDLVPTNVNMYRVASNRKSPKTVIKKKNIPPQHITNGSLFVYRSLSSGFAHFPPSSDCRSLNQVSLKEPNAVALLDDFGLLQLFADDD
jgi:hypothetical protein